jgi:RNA recognition motif-containing protein
MNFWITVGVALLIGLVVGFVFAKVACSGKGAKKEKKRISNYAHASSGCVEIYVGNLSYDMTEDQLRKAFAKFGKVEMARIITNRFGKSKGFGFVEMPNREEAEAAVKALDNQEVMGRKMRANEAKNKNRE